MEIDTRRATVRAVESLFGDIATDAMKQVTGADVAIFGGGSIRGDKVYPAGTTFTRKDVFTELPFGDKT